MKHRASIRGAELAYDVTGDGPPVMLVMGFGMSGRAWKPLVDRLSDRYTLCAFDMRGLGQSSPGARRDHTFKGMAADVAALMDHLGWSDAHVAGVSMGGMVSQHLALRHADRVRSLALIATHAGGFLHTLPGREGLQLFLQANRAHTPMARLKVLQRVLYPPHARQDLDAISEEALDEMLSLSAPSPGWVRALHLVAVVSHDLRGALHRIDVPTVVVRPDLDVLVPPHCSDLIAARMPNATLHAFPDAAHGVLRQCSDAVADLLDDHWRPSHEPDSTP